MVEIIEQRLGPRLAVTAEHLDADHLTQQARGHMVRRTPDKPAGLLGPGNQCLPALHQLLMISRLLPTAVDPPMACPGLEGQPLEVAGPGLKIIERGRRPDGVAESRVGRDIGDAGAIDIDGAAVAQRREMLGLGLAVHCAVACSADAQAFAREAERRRATVANSFAGTLAGSDDAGDLAWETHTEPPLPTNVTMSPSRSLRKFV
jgi:hypothetical protein